MFCGANLILCYGLILLNGSVARNRGTLLLEASISCLRMAWEIRVQSQVNTQHYKGMDQEQVEQSWERHSAFPYISILQLMKNEAFGFPPTRIGQLIYIYIYIYVCVCVCVCIRFRSWLSWRQWDNLKTILKNCMSTQILTWNSGVSFFSR